MFFPVSWTWILILAILLIIMFSVFYKKIENHFVFAPQKKLDFSPSDYHMTWRDVYLDTPDGCLLHGWYFEASEGPVVLFCHGNAGNISHRLDFIKVLNSMALNVFIFDYRGYGKSTGKPSEKGLYIDALCAYDYLVEKENKKPEEIILLGRSLGAAAAIEIAGKRKVRLLISESGFLSTRHMAGHMGIYRLISPFVPANFNNLEKIKNISVPKLIIHGDADEMIPFSMGERLFKEAAEPKQFYAVKGAGHNDTYVVGGEEYREVLRAFVNKR